MPAETDSPALPTFDVLPLSAEVRQAVDELGYVHPTPVQAAVFESASRGRDLVVQARTGTGKTAAFGLPLIDAIVRRKEAKVQALILCPTRELALQVTRELEALSKHRGTRVVAIYGGAPMPKQVEQIRAGAQILVGTPGRVLDHLIRGTLDASSLRVVVLDESDEMLSMGFWPQISDIFSRLPESRQTLLFSATLPPDIRRLSETRLKNPEFITLSGDHIGALEIGHFVYISRGDKLAELVQIIEVENSESAIVFCNTRDETKRVCAALVQQGYAADWLNADLPQNDREKVMAATRQGKLRFLVATDVAARGIDISHLTHVINFDFPDSAEYYVHRTGRTGRAGRTGVAISLIEPRDIGNLYLLRLTYKLRPIERQLPSAGELKTRAEADLVGFFIDGFGKRKVHPDDLALARRLLTHEQAEQVVAGLLRDHLGARPDALDDATAARRARPPRAADGASETELGQVSAPQAVPIKSEPKIPSGAGSPPGQSALADVPAPQLTAARPPPPQAVPLRQPTPLATPMKPVRPLPVPQAAPAEQTARPLAPVVEPPPRPNDAARSESRRDPELNAGSGEADEIVELYASVGRRQGAKPSDYEHLLEARGVPTDAVVYVRVRHRNAFVAVHRKELESVLSALEGATIAGRIVKAELSRGGLREKDFGDPGEAEDVDAV